MFIVNLRIILLFMLSVASCYASADSYDPLLLRAQASIFPKIVLLDKSLAGKTYDGEITIAIVSSAQDAPVAKQLKSTMQEKYGDTLGDNKMNVTVITFDDFNPEIKATAYIILQGSESSFRKVVSHAASHNRIVFSYSYTDFAYDALISMRMKEKTYIYINKSTVQSYGISFLPVFYKIANIIK